jgi:tetratricopeptide (TPR) repeat protein
MMLRPTLISTLLFSLFCASLPAEEPGAQNDEQAVREEQVRRTTAVALNYCRAALHRIRRQPHKHIFYEEQTRILNNLDLNQIEDPEVITLYTSILDEISTVEISERERVVIKEQFRRNVHRQLGTSFFVIGAQVATGQLGTAVQSGANSWWDYRNQEVRRDADQWKVEKTEFSNLMNRSSTFLDSFWKLSRKNNIPDRWLIRDQDLDHLAHILAERDPETRLRMLNRIERFMECYPPYWYYVARTQQQLGQKEQAIETYQRLSEIGSGHFRQDDMLASCMANMALLQELDGHPDAARTASRVNDYSIRNWEANLVCAWILGRHQQFDDAEELILCNLDEDEETSQSRVALVSLYYHSEDRPKLAELLKNPEVVRDVPIPGLLLSARLLGTNGMPRTAQTYLASTLSASVRRVSRGEAVTLAASNGWKLRDARPEIAAGGHVFRSVGFRPGATDRAEFLTDSHAADDRDIRVTLNYPGTPAIHITLNRQQEEPVREDSAFPVGRLPFPGVVKNPAAALISQEVRYEIGAIELDGVRLSFNDDVINEAAAGEKEVSAEESTTTRS